jgi:hypothetical protein
VRRYDRTRVEVVGPSVGLPEAQEIVNQMENP